MCVVRKLVIGLTSRFKISLYNWQGVVQQHIQPALTQKLVKVLYHLFPFLD